METSYKLQVRCFTLLDIHTEGSGLVSNRLVSSSASRGSIATPSTKNQEPRTTPSLQGPCLPCTSLHLQSSIFDFRSSPPQIRPALGPLRPAKTSITPSSMFDVRCSLFDIRYSVHPPLHAHHHVCCLTVWLLPSLRSIILRSIFDFRSSIFDPPRPSAPCPKPPSLHRSIM